MKRRLVARGFWTLLLALALLFLGGDTFGAGDPLALLTRSHLYSIAGWEVGNFPKKWLHAFWELLPGSSSQEEKVQEVRHFFELAAQAQELRSQIGRAREGSSAEPGLPALEQRLLHLLAQQDELTPAVERTLEGMISSVLREEGLFTGFLFARFLWPPVDFRADSVPHVLIISTRSRIELLNTRLLEPDLTMEEIAALEAAVDGRNLSSLVEGLGGIATYPSLIPEDSSLPRALELAAHEWTHHYLFFRSLGQRYGSSEAMTTLNETVADLVGQEIGQAIYHRFFVPPPAEPAPKAEAARERPSFDLHKELRETRLVAEGLLAEGRIDEAEAYMEERRRFLAKHGYLFRKLNQAFFAFHGTYADQPGAVSPIGEQLRTLRQQSSSLGEFLRRVSSYSSYDDLKRDLGLGGEGT